MTQKAIQVGGLHRSGTTVVHFLLGAHPDCISLGEVYGLISSRTELQRANEIGCSCGQFADKCEFWGPLVPNLTGDGDYAPVLERVKELYGERTTVDSSKSPEARDALDAVRVMVIRDVRAWMLSTKRVGISGMRDWHKRNKALLADSPGTIVSYDELILRQEESLQRLCNSVGLSPAIEQMLDYGQVEHHAVRCNRMKGDPAKMAGLTYDNRWCYDNRWVLPAAILPQVMRFNSENVYGYVKQIF